MYSYAESCSRDKLDDQPKSGDQPLDLLRAKLAETDVTRRSASQKLQVANHKDSTRALWSRAALSLPTTQHYYTTYEFKTLKTTKLYEPSLTSSLHNTHHPPLSILPYQVTFTSHPKRRPPSHSPTNPQPTSLILN
ncbi:hypothetical protein O3P69_020885 [Scylla paramamosain]|uniref:Uncharacterized protein n=1 Tax=Scylla paramamosain TaxID=85552 RepID=A0AAW0TPN7_SCYPA